MNGQVIKKFNHLQIKDNIIDPGLKNKVANIKLKWTDEDIDEGSLVEQALSKFEIDSSVGRNSIRKNDEVYVNTGENVYDHNAFNVYNTNTSVDFITNSLKFIDRESRDPEVDIHNWDAHIILPKKPGVNLENGVGKDIRKVFTVWQQMVNILILH